MEKEKKYKLITALLLFTLIITIGTSILLFTTDTIGFKVTDKCKVETNNEDNITNNTLNSFTTKETSGNYYNEKGNCHLILYSNGIFKYEFTDEAPVGVVGNYKVKDNNIILNYLFNTNSGNGFDMTEGTKILKIVENGSIMDDNIINKTLIQKGITSITLLATSEPLDNTKVTEYILNNLTDSVFKSGEIQKPNL